MTYAFTYEVPIDTEIYARIKDGIGPEPAPGMIAHLAYRTETGLRYLDVWQSKDDWDAFEHDRVHPAGHTLLQEIPGVVPAEPSRAKLELVAAWTVHHARRDR